MRRPTNFAPPHADGQLSPAAFTVAAGNERESTLYYYATRGLGNVGRHRLDFPGQHEIRGIIHFILPAQSGKFLVTATRYITFRKSNQTMIASQLVLDKTERMAVQWNWSVLSPPLTATHRFVPF